MVTSSAAHAAAYSAMPNSVNTRASREQPGSNAAVRTVLGAAGGADGALDGESGKKKNDKKIKHERPEDFYVRDEKKNVSYENNKQSPAYALT
jgi:hypothetical protein